MGGLAAGPVGTPATVSGHRLRRRTQTVVNYVEDAYLRDDVCCGSALCASCVPPPGAPPTPLRADASHYLVPDADALVAYLDFLESPSARDVVLLASEAKAAHALGDARVSRAIRALCGDRRGRVKLFPNDHCRATSVVNPARRREILRSLPFDALPSSSAAVAALVHPVLRAAAWYASHAVRGAFPVVVLSDTIRPDRLDGAVPTGVEVLDADAYFARFHADDPATTRLYESIVSAREEGAEEGAECLKGAEFRRSRRRVAFAPHLSPSALADGLAAGELLEGAIRVSPRAPDEAVVSTRGGGVDADAFDADAAFAAGDVLIPTRALRNRAFDGDVVAVRLLPASRWVESRSRSVVDDEPNDDEPNDDDTDDKDEEESSEEKSSSEDRRAPPETPRSRPPRKTARADGGGGRRPSRAWRGSRRDHLRGGRDGAFVQPDAKRVVRERLGDSFRSPRAETSTAHASRAGIRRPTSFGSRRRVARDESTSGRARASRLGSRRGRRRGDGGALGAFRHSRRAVHSRGVGESSPRGCRVDRLRR